MAPKRPKQPGGKAHRFGGGWTTAKLDVLANYLASYTTALKDKPSKEHPFRKGYIDAFAGTGYRDARRDDFGESSQALLLPDLAEKEPQALLDGSARLALKTEPRFDRYVFIERSPERCAQLEILKSEFPHLASDIQIRQGDANAVIQELCGKDWSSRRAVLFLDPYGMQVDLEDDRGDRRDEGDRPVAALPARHRREPPAHEVWRHPRVVAAAP